MRRFAPIALAVAFGASSFAQSGAPSASSLAARLQQRYNTIHDFTASFTHVEQDGFRPQKTTETGQVKIKKPARMRWTYGGSKNEMIADGTLVYWCDRANRSVDESVIPTGSDVSTAILFLAGKGDLVKDFHATLAPVQPASGWRLDLVPTSTHAEFTSLSLMVDRDLKLTGFEAVDAQGATQTFTFTNLKENVGLPDSDFSFSPPHNFDVHFIK
jgi:chaperone LolA